MKGSSRLTRAVRKEAFTIVLVVTTAGLLWYAITIDRGKLVPALGLLVTAVLFETIRHVFGKDQRDQA